VEHVLGRKAQGEVLESGGVWWWGDRSRSRHGYGGLKSRVYAHGVKSVVVGGWFSFVADIAANLVCDFVTHGGIRCATLPGLILYTLDGDDTHAVRALRLDSSLRGWGDESNHTVSSAVLSPHTVCKRREYPSLRIFQAYRRKEGINLSIRIWHLLFIRR
jgi:hypothetical protein